MFTIVAERLQSFAEHHEAASVSLLVPITPSYARTDTHFQTHMQSDKEGSGSVRNRKRWVFIKCL